MRIGKSLAMFTVVLIGSGAMQPALAQGYYNPPYGGPDQNNRRDQFDRRDQNDRRDRNPAEDAYRQGYRAGYTDGRSSRRYDDTDYTYGAGYNTGPTSNDNEQRWRQRYSRTYTYNDDNFYQQCRQSPDPAGVLAGALLGGILGNAVGRGGGGATVAGVIAGGALGAALTKNLNCEDRSYAYKTYYDGFNAGRANTGYQWSNPRNGHYGDFRVGDYYSDPSGFRCANYTQRIYIGNQPQAAAGRACQQPDGTWVIVN